MADEEIPLLSREGDKDKGDEGEQETSFGGGGNVDSRAQGRGARPKTKTKTKTSSHTNPSFEVDVNKDIDDIIRKMLKGEDLTNEEDRRLNQFKEEENLRIKTTTYDDGSISAGGYVGSIMISKNGEERYYFYGVAKNTSINEFKKIYPKLDKDKLGKLEFGMSKGGTPVVRIRRTNGKVYTIDYEETKIVNGKDKGQRRQYNKTIKEVLGNSLYDEIDEREGRINELNEANEELKKTNEEIRKKKTEEFSQKEEKNNNKIKELKAKSKEDEEAISSLKKGKERLKKEKDEASKQAEKDHEERLKQAKKDNEEKLKQANKDYEGKLKKNRNKRSRQMKERRWKN